MTLHAHLAELVAARGADVLADPGEFRAALDDYLTDDEISPGDRNVLVDAVRLGAVRRLLVLLDQGSDPRAAVNEAGIALARERGSDDARRSMRATALLGYAAGRLHEGVVRDFDLAVPPSPPNPSPIPSPIAPSPAPSAQTRVEPPWSTPPTAPANRRGARVLLLVGLGVVILALVGAGTWWFLLRGGTPEDAVDELFATRTCEDAADLMTGTAADEMQTQIDETSEAGLCAIYGDLSSDYDVTSVDERNDRATVKVEGTQHYDGSDESVPEEQDFTAVIDLRRIDGEWLISDLDWVAAE